MEIARPQFSPLVFVILIFSVFLGGGHAQDQPVSQEALATTIIDNPTAQVDRKTMEEALLDTTVRPVFRQLRKEAGWNPDHPTWKRDFSEFCVAYKALTDQYAASINDRLRSALATGLSESELREVIAFQRDPKLMAALDQMKKIGMDAGSTYRMMGVMMSPGLYSQEEKDNLKLKLQALKKHEVELLSMKPGIDAAMSALQQPALAKYQKILTSTLLESVRRSQADPRFKQAMSAFLLSWKDRVIQ